MHSSGYSAGNGYSAGTLSRKTCFFIRVIGSESGVKLKSPAIKKGVLHFAPKAEIISMEALLSSLVRDKCLTENQ